ncbi:hypothetical protein L6255_03470 [Candidatus Parcubacteria bacterium]|nr:hypothetical protein [Patescibacteria group bacterium]MBU4380952.1 hypothetical protein [Patescibacteria group bacterium]MCG2689470.1 hypothetical protein [Candidatus Parcubacteria bacterium]
MGTITKETIELTKELGKVLERLNIGRSFRIFGGLGLLISLSGGNDLALKVAILTFTFGALSKVLEMLNDLWPKNTILQSIIWFLFVVAYSLLVNNLIEVF